MIFSFVKTRFIEILQIIIIIFFFILNVYIILIFFVFIMCRRPSVIIKRARYRCRPTTM